MENRFFRCTQRAITQRRVITLGPIFIKMVLNQAQGLKKKSQEVSARKNNNRQRYNKKCRRGGGGFRPRPALLGLNTNFPFQLCAFHLGLFEDRLLIKMLLKRAKTRQLFFFFFESIASNNSFTLIENN